MWKGTPNMADRTEREGKYVYTGGSLRDWRACLWILIILSLITLFLASGLGFGFIRSRVMDQFFFPNHSQNPEEMKWRSTESEVKGGFPATLNHELGNDVRRKLAECGLLSVDASLEKLLYLVRLFASFTNLTSQGAAQTPKADHKGENSTQGTKTDGDESTQKLPSEETPSERLNAKKKHTTREGETPEGILERYYGAYPPPVASSTFSFFRWWKAQERSSSSSSSSSVSSLEDSAVGEVHRVNVEAEQQLHDDGYATHVARSTTFWSPAHLTRRGYGLEGSIFVVLVAPPTAMTIRRRKGVWGWGLEAELDRARCAMTVESVFTHARWPAGVFMGLPEIALVDREAPAEAPAQARLFSCIPHAFTTHAVGASYGLEYKDHIRTRRVNVPVSFSTLPNPSNLTAARRLPFSSTHAARVAALQLYRGESYVIFLRAGVVLTPSWDWRLRLMYLRLPQPNRAVLTSRPLPLFASPSATGFPALLLQAMRWTIREIAAEKAETEGPCPAASGSPEAPFTLQELRCRIERDPELGFRLALPHGPGFPVGEGEAEIPPASEPHPTRRGSQPPNTPLPRRFSARHASFRDFVLSHRPEEGIEAAGGESSPSSAFTTKRRLFFARDGQPSLSAAEAFVLIMNPPKSLLEETAVQSPTTRPSDEGLSTAQDDIVGLFEVSPGKGVCEDWFVAETQAIHRRRYEICWIVANRDRIKAHLTLQVNAVAAGAGEVSLNHPKTVLRDPCAPSCSPFPFEIVERRQRRGSDCLHDMRYFESTSTSSSGFLPGRTGALSGPDAIHLSDRNALRINCLYSTLSGDSDWSEETLSESTTPFWLQGVASSDFLFTRAEAFFNHSTEDELLLSLTDLTRRLFARRPDENTSARGRRRNEGDLQTTAHRPEAVHLDPYLFYLTDDETDLYLSATLWTSGFNFFAPTEAIARWYIRESDFIPHHLHPTRALDPTEGSSPSDVDESPPLSIRKLREATLRRWREIFTVHAGSSANASNLARRDPTLLRALGRQRSLRRYLEFVGLSLQDVIMKETS